MPNPFAITFGIRPEQYIPRIEQRETIISTFHQTPSPTQAYVLLGVRGSGKTVLLTEVAEKIGSDWITLDISTQTDMLQSFTSQLYGDASMHKLFVKVGFDFSFMGLGVHTESSVPAFDCQTALTMMLTEIKKQNRRVLLIVDEADNSEGMRQFASVFQILIRKGLPVYLLMAGLPERVYGLMNEKTSTFLLRTPRIMMTPLNYIMIKKSYIRELSVDGETAETLASLTSGYPFAYQALGYVCWGKKVDVRDASFVEILSMYDFYLQEFSYLKIWDEMSRKDRRLAQAIAQYDDYVKVGVVQKDLDINAKEFSVYRDRLKRKGILDTGRYGEIRFSLPRFSEFVREMPI